METHDVQTCNEVFNLWYCKYYLCGTSKSNASRPITFTYFVLRIKLLSRFWVFKLKQNSPFKWSELCQNCFCLPSDKGSTLKGKNLLPMGSNSLLLEWTSLGVHENQTGIYKCVVPWKCWTIYHVCLVTLTHCRLNRLSHTIYWKRLISILGTPG